MKRITLAAIIGVLLLGATKAVAGSYIQKVQSMQPASMVGYWPLNETSGGTAADLSGNNNDAIYSGASLGQWQSPDGGLAAFVDGMYSYISVLDTPAMSPDSQITLCFWWARVSPWLFDNAYLAQKSTGAWNDGGYGIFWAVVGSFRVGAWVDSYSDNLILYDLPDQTEWIHLCLTYDSEWVRLYKDGIEVQAISRPGLTIRPVSDALYINSGGAYAHLAIWENALTAEEIAIIADPAGTPDATPTPALPTYSESIALSSGRTAGLFYSLTAGDILIALFLFMLLGVATLSLIIAARRK